MNSYRSHRVVEAAKIVDISREYGPERGATTHMENDEEVKVYGPTQGATLRLEGDETVKVSVGYLSKHQPSVGGYFVLYEDGYASWSPADVFEAGYTEIVPA